jgi:hypothetical protein
VLCKSAKTRLGLQKRPFSNPTFFDLSEIWHKERFYQKTEVRLLFRQKSYRVTNFSIFHDFSIILSLITQRVFIAKTCAWVRWKGYILSKIQKIKKTTNDLDRTYIIKLLFIGNFFRFFKNILFE